MTGPEYRALRESLGWSQQKLAEALESYQSTVGRRETGKLPIHREAEYALRWLASAARAPHPLDGLPTVEPAPKQERGGCEDEAGGEPA